MVNLPDPDQERARERARRTVRALPLPRPASYYHDFGLSRRRGEVTYPPDPTGLLQLEALARKAVEVMERHNPKSENNYVLCMDLLRLQYNLNFIVVCEKCGGKHVQDELTAPER